MKKKAITAVAVFLLVLLLVPIPMRLKDGGTVRYQAMLYSISDVHRLAPSQPDGYEDGIVVEILGMQVYSRVDRKTETIPFHEHILNKSDLSQETLEWLQWYNGLTEQEQLSISYIPADLYRLCGYGSGDDIPAETG